MITELDQLKEALDTLIKKREEFNAECDRAIAAVRMQIAMIESGADMNEEH